MKVSITNDARLLIEEQSKFILDEYNMEEVVLAIRHDSQDSCSTCSQSSGCTDCATQNVIQLADKEDLELLGCFTELENGSNKNGIRIYIENDILQCMDSELNLTIDTLGGKSFGRNAELTLIRDYS